MDLAEITTQPDVTTWTWELTGTELAKTVEKLEKINKRAVDRGLVGRWSWTTTDRQHPVYDKHALCLDKDRPIIGYKILHELTVTGTPPRFGGWVFAATITDSAGAMVLRVSPKYLTRIDRTKLVPHQCDHCGIRRKRSKTYLLHNAITQELTQVGSACVKDFLGQGFSASYVDEEDLITKIRDRSIGSGIEAPTEYLVPLALAVALVVIDRYGWVSAGEVMEGRPSTGSRVREALDPPDRPVEAKQLSQEVLRLAADRLTEAQEVLDWVTSTTSNNNYLDNLQTIITVGRVSKESLNLLASAPQAYARAREETLRRKSDDLNEWYGEQDRKFAPVRVLVVSADSKESHFGGNTILYIFKTPEGHTLKMFSPKWRGWEPGEYVTITGTISSFDSYNGRRTTKITRVSESIAA